MYMLWGIETSHRARFASSGKLHTLLDLAGNLILILAASSIEEVHTYRGSPEHANSGVGLSLVLLWVMAGSLIWMLRTAEVAFLAKREAARRESLSELSAMAQVLGLLATAFAILLVDFGDGPSNATASDLAALLLWGSNLLWLFKRGARAYCYLLVPGRRIIERLMTPVNGAFTYHRNNEFMFLMLGETVLAMAITVTGTSTNASFVDHIFSVHASIISCGFILAWCMMLSFRLMVNTQLEAFSRVNDQVQEVNDEEAKMLSVVQELRCSGWPMSSLFRQTTAVRHMVDSELCSASAADGEADDALKAFRLIMHARVVNVATELIWQILAISVMLMGVGTKIALYDPQAAADAHFALELRLLISLPLVTAFGSILLQSVVLKNRHHYDLRLHWVAGNRSHAIILVARTVLLGLMFGLAWLELEPVSFVGVQAVATLVSALLLHVHEVRFTISSDNAHPLQDLADVLNGMRTRSRRARDGAHGRNSERVSEIEDDGSHSFTHSTREVNFHGRRSRGARSRPTSCSEAPDMNESGFATTSLQIPPTAESSVVHAIAQGTRVCKGGVHGLVAAASTVGDMLDEGDGAHHGHHEHHGRAATELPMGLP